MVNDAHVFLAGYVATEPILSKTPSGTPKAKLRVAYTSHRLNRDTGEWSDGPTTFVSVQCWRTLADNVAMCVRKGEPVLVRGRMQVRPYENAAGEARLSVDVDATSIGHDLSRGVAHFSRTRWPSAETAAEATEEQGTPAPRAEAPDGAPEEEAFAPPAPAADGVVDERAVAEFARELSESLAADGETGVPA